MEKAWLVTWEWSGKHAERKNKIASILNYRLSGDTVAKYMEMIYVSEYYNLRERLAYAKSREDNPYPAQFDTLEVDGRRAPWKRCIYCGHNPHLYGRLVQNIHVELRHEVARGE